MGLQRFTDYETAIRGKWFDSEPYHSQLSQLVKWGLIRGYPDGSFRPGRWGGDVFVEFCIITYRKAMSEHETSIIDSTMGSLVHVRGKGVGRASGFWTPDWRVVTNAHVVYFEYTEGKYAPAYEVEVYGNPGAGFSPTEPMQATIEKTDHANDLVMLQVLPPSYDVKPEHPVLSSREMRSGLGVFALGHPYSLTWDVARGTIRHPERYINYWDVEQEVMGLDVAINPGNSGGMLVDYLSQLVGVPCAGVMAGNNFTFAIPIQKVRDLIGG